MVIPLFSNTSHKRHNPPFEYDHGLPVAYRETPERISLIQHALLTNGLVSPVDTPVRVDTAEIQAIHAPEMVDFIKSTAMSRLSETDYLFPESFAIRKRDPNRTIDPIGQFGLFATDPYSPIGQNTWLAAVESAFLATAAASWVASGKADCVYALCRPPGHHAGPDFFGSYCYLNNTAIAARQLGQLGKVAILDIDYHHGNGTQQIFWDDPEVLFVSLHIDPASDYPFYWGYSDETGGDQAGGWNKNFPLPPGTEDLTYLETLKTALDVITRFDPKSLIVSLGFDGYRDDPFSAFNLSLDAYTQIGVIIGGLHLPTVLVQEGGYCLPLLGQLAVNFLTGFRS